MQVFSRTVSPLTVSISDFLVSASTVTRGCSTLLTVWKLTMAAWAFSGILSSSVVISELLRNGIRFWNDSHD